MMTDSRALDADRLPWLTNDEKPAKRRGGSPIVTGGVVTLLLVAGLSYWAGRVVQVPVDDQPAWTEIAQQTVELPDPAPEATAALESGPTVTPVAAPPAEIAKPAPRIAPAAPTAGERAAVKLERKVRVERKPTAAKSGKAAAAKGSANVKRAAKRKVRRARPVPHWPRPIDAVSLGRIIRLGTYSSLEKNQRAWQSAVQRYPQMRGLPKITGVYRGDDGRLRYPLFIMTTARAQSDWLCREGRRDWRSCRIITA